MYIYNSGHRAGPGKWDCHLLATTKDENADLWVEIKDFSGEEAEYAEKSEIGCPFTKPVSGLVRGAGAYATFEQTNAETCKAKCCKDMGCKSLFVKHGNVCVLTSASSDSPQFKAGVKGDRKVQFLEKEKAACRFDREVHKGSISGSANHLAQVNNTSVRACRDLCCSDADCKGLFMQGSQCTLTRVTKMAAGSSWDPAAEGDGAEEGPPQYVDKWMNLEQNPAGCAYNDKAQATGSIDGSALVLSSIDDLPEEQDDGSKIPVMQQCRTLCCGHADCKAVNVKNGKVCVLLKTTKAMAGSAWSDAPYGADAPPVPDVYVEKAPPEEERACGWTWWVWKPQVLGGYLGGKDVDDILIDKKDNVPGMNACKALCCATDGCRAVWIKNGGERCYLSKFGSESEIPEGTSVSFRKGAPGYQFQARWLVPQLPHDTTPKLPPIGPPPTRADRFFIESQPCRTSPAHPFNFTPPVFGVVKAGEVSVKFVLSTYQSVSPTALYLQEGMSGREERL